MKINPENNNYSVKNNVKYLYKNSIFSVQYSCDDINIFL